MLTRLPLPTMPEVAVNKERDTARVQEKVRFACKLGVMRTKSQTSLAQSAAEEFLGRCAARFYTRHKG